MAWKLLIFRDLYEKPKSGSGSGGCPGGRLREVFSIQHFEISRLLKSVELRGFDHDKIIYSALGTPARVVATYSI